MVKRLKLTVGLLSLLFYTVIMPISSSVKVLAAGVSSRFDKLSDSSVSAVATHLFGFNYTDNATAVGSVVFEFCANDPLFDSACVVPSGLNVSSATLASQTGFTGFTIDSGSTTANKLVIHRVAAAAPPAGSSTYQFNTVTNPNSAGSYYVRLSTHTSLDGSGSMVEYGGLVFAILQPFSVTSEVEPYLLFCTAVSINNFDCASATTYAIDFGELSPSAASSTSSQFLVATNAGLGYNVSVSGTTLTSGSNTIPAIASQAASNPGSGQFGLNLRANTNPSGGNDPAGPGTGTPSPGYNTPNLFQYISGDTIASSTSTSDFRKFTVSYLVNINANQPAGYYATTLSFICLGNF